MDNSFYSKFYDLCEVKNCSHCKQSCMMCNGKFVLWKKEPCTVYTHTFKPYFDVTLGKEVQSEKEIKEYCAKNDMVYAGDKELTQQCEQNKRELAQKQDEKFVQELSEKISEVM